MKRREMNSIAVSLCEHLCSRNNDILGYWGIGILCVAARMQPRSQISFRIRPGFRLTISGYELSGSKEITAKLVQRDLDAIEGLMTFIENGRYPSGATKYACSISIAVSQKGRTGLGFRQTECWSHHPKRELRRARICGQHGVRPAVEKFAFYRITVLERFAETNLTGDRHLICRYAAFEEVG